MESRDAVKVVRSAALDAAILAGGGRATAVAFAGVGDGHTWIVARLWAVAADGFPVCAGVHMIVKDADLER